MESYVVLRDLAIIIIFANDFNTQLHIIATWEKITT